MNDVTLLQDSTQPLIGWSVGFWGFHEHSAQVHHDPCWLANIHSDFGVSLLGLSSSACSRVSHPCILRVSPVWRILCCQIATDEVKTGSWLGGTAACYCLPLTTDISHRHTLVYHPSNSTSKARLPKLPTLPLYPPEFQPFRPSSPLPLRTFLSLCLALSRFSRLLSLFLSSPSLSLSLIGLC